MEVWIIIILTVVVLGGGGGGFALLWYITRPKKMTWKAYVYQRSDGVQPYLRDKKTGAILSNIKLSDLRPYTTDILERVEKSKGVIMYWLQKLKKVTPPVSSNVVEYWGEKNKIVRVLLDGETVTLLKQGYDKTTGTAIFKPLQVDRVNTIKMEISERRERIREKKDILSSITPWVVTGISILGLIMISYVIGQAWIESSENAETTAHIYKESNQLITAMLIEARPDLFNKTDDNTQNLNIGDPPIVKG